MRRNSMHEFMSLVAALVTQSVADESSPCNQVISRDVIVVGGGAAGAHAAVWLRDHNQSVIVVEKADQLGGHTAFYNDPDTGKTINVGVQAWMEYKGSFDLAKRMNVSTNGSMQFSTLEYKYVDFKTGQPVADFTTPAPEDMYSALQRYLAVLEKYEDMVLLGFFNFPKPESIPEDLLMPFGQFVKKYDIAAAVPQIWDSTAQGLGDTMNVPTLFVVQASGIPMVRALLGTASAAVPPSGRLFDLYERIAEFLGNDVLYSSTVISATRHSEKGVSLKVKVDDGELICIDARRLLIAFEPTTENMMPFRLDETEKEVFERFNYTTVYAGILRHSSLQLSTAYSNRSPAPGSSNYTVFPTASQFGRIDYIDGTKNLFQFTAVGTADDTSESMQKLVGRSTGAMIDAGTIHPSNGNLSFAAFANHGKLHPRLTADDLRADFVQKQLGLQGHRSMWYTGAAFSAGFTTALWEYNNVLLPSMVEGM